MVRGRQICLGECTFIFKRIWKATLDGCNHQAEGEGDHLHNENQRFPNEIMISDLFHILDMAGTLLNKAEPDNDDTAPFDEFMRYAKQ